MAMSPTPAARVPAGLTPGIVPSSNSKVDVRQCLARKAAAG